MIVSKTDLLPYVPFELDKVIQEAKDVNNDIETFELSSLKGKGMDAWCDYLLAQLEKKRSEKLITTPKN